MSQNCKTGNIIERKYYYEQYRATSKSRTDMINTWMFMVNNSDAEWRIHEDFNNTFMLSTFKKRSASPSDGQLGISTSSVQWMLHNHGGIDLYHEATSMGTDYIAAMKYGGFYVYFNNSKNLYSLQKLEGNVGVANWVVNTGGNLSIINSLVK